MRRKQIERACRGHWQGPTRCGKPLVRAVAAVVPPAFSQSDLGRIYRILPPGGRSRIGSRSRPPHHRPSSPPYRAAQEAFAQPAIDPQRTNRSPSEIVSFSPRPRMCRRISKLGAEGVFCWSTERQLRWGMPTRTRPVFCSQALTSQGCGFPWAGSRHGCVLGRVRASGLRPELR